MRRGITIAIVFIITMDHYHHHIVYLWDRDGHRGRCFPLLSHHVRPGCVLLADLLFCNICNWYLWQTSIRLLQKVWGESRKASGKKRKTGAGGKGSPGKDDHFSLTEISIFSKFSFSERLSIVNAMFTRPNGNQDRNLITFPCNSNSNGRRTKAAVKVVF